MTPQNDASDIRPLTHVLGHDSAGRFGKQDLASIIPTPAPVINRMPVNNRVAVFSHSKGAMNAIANASNGQLTRALSHGWLTWARALSGQRVRFTAADMGALPGDTIVPATRGGTTYPGMTTRIDGLLSQTDAGTIVMQLHTNRTNSISTATGVEITVEESIAGMEEILGKCRAAGRVVVLLTDDPRGDNVNTGNRLPAADVRRAAQINRYIKRLANTPGIYVIDTWDVSANWLSGFGDLQPGLTYDGLHQVQVLGYRIGSQLAALFTRWFAPSREIVPMSNTDIFNASENPRGNLLAQAYFGGAGGTLSSSGASASAQSSPSGANAAGIASNWTENIAPATGLTAAYSKVTGARSFKGANYDGDSPRDWQQINLGGMPTVSAEVAILRQGIPAASLTVGDIIAATVEVEVDNMSGLAGFGIRLISPGLGNVLLASDMGPTTDTAAYQMPGGPWSGILRTLDLTLPTASIAFEITCTTIANQAVNAAVRVRAAGVSKQ